jgi:hypothetical protein
MKTLVIHPDDTSTDFLKVIYDDKDWNVITSHKSKSQLKDLIQEHDRIVMLGHGSGGGLIGDLGYEIDGSLADTLRPKKCVFVWCHAKSFVEKYNLKGFYTDMFISELYEAMFHAVKSSANEVYESNHSFARAFNRGIDADDILTETMKGYDDTSLVAKFNKDRLYFKP